MSLYASVHISDFKEFNMSLKSLVITVISQVNLFESNRCLIRCFKHVTIIMLEKYFQWRQGDPNCILFSISYNFAVDYNMDTSLIISLAQSKCSVESCTIKVSQTCSRTSSLRSNLLSTTSPPQSESCKSEGFKFLM